MTSYVFIDPLVSDFDVLLENPDPDAAAFILDPARDGLAQIAQALDGVTGLDAIHIISHGSEGTLYLGNTVVTSKSLTNYTSELSATRTLALAITDATATPVVVQQNGGAKPWPDFITLPLPASCSIASFRLSQVHNRL